MALDLSSHLSLSSSLLVPLDYFSAHGFSSSQLTTAQRRSNQSFQFPRNFSCRSSYTTEFSSFLRSSTPNLTSRKRFSVIPRSSGSSSPDGGKDDSKASNQKKVPFGYSRKDVLLIGVGVTVIGVGLKSGLEFVGVDPLQAGNVVQLVLVLGLTIGWISTYIFRVSNKEMTYAQQLRDYESKVMEWNSILS